QISAQLQSSHAASQLNLGKLSHPKDQAESEDRGEGFELRTDQWGAVRAGEGLLLSTHKQDQAKGEHLDAQPAKQQLEGNQSNAKALSEVAKNQQTDEIESIEQLKAFAEEIEADIAKFNKAMLLLSSSNGIGLSTNEDIHLSADGQINQFAGDSINLSTQKNLITHAQNRISLFAAQNGIKQVAAKGKFEAHAQSDGMDLLAKQGIQIISTEDRIEISSPKEIVITAGGSQIKLNGSGVFPTTGGKFEVKAGQHLFMGGASVSPNLPALPALNLLPKELELKYVYDDLKPVIQAPYKLIFSDGTSQEGILDANGYAKVPIPGDKTQSKVYYGFSLVEAKPDKEKVANPFKDRKVMSVAEAEQLIEQYNQQELATLLDEYFPDEIEDMIKGDDIEYDDHISDYEEHLIASENNAEDVLEDDAEEILLSSEESTSGLGLGDKQ
ncbi:type VI secretion system Vgr family protein, partial [Acinetobacter beijerinckii]